MRKGCQRPPTKKQNKKTTYQRTPPNVESLLVASFKALLTMTNKLVLRTPPLSYMVENEGFNLKINRARHDHSTPQSGTGGDTASSSSHGAGMHPGQ